MVTRLGARSMSRRRIALAIVVNQNKGTIATRGAMIAARGPTRTVELVIAQKKLAGSHFVGRRTFEAGRGTPPTGATAAALVTGARTVALAKGEERETGPVMMM